MFQNITVDELKKIDNANIIDIRNSQSYNNNHIPGAINIQFDQILTHPDKYLDPNKIYYIYCQKGYTSTSVCRNLAAMGYKVVNIVGGYEEWIMKN